MDVTVRYIEPSHIEKFQPRSGTIKEVVETAEKGIAKKIGLSFGVGVDIDPSSTAVYIDGQLRDHRERKFASQPWARITEKSVVIDAYPITGEDGFASNSLQGSIKERTDEHSEMSSNTAKPARFTSDPSTDVEEGHAGRLEKLPLMEVRETGDPSQVIGVGNALRASQTKINTLIDENALMVATIQRLAAETNTLKTEMENVRSAMKMLTNALRPAPADKASIDPLAAALENAKAMAVSSEPISDMSSRTERTGENAGRACAIPPP